MEVEAHRLLRAAGDNHRKYLLVPLRARLVVRKAESTPERVRQKSMSDDGFWDLSLGEPGNHHFVRVEERQLKPSVCKYDVPFVGLKLVCSLAEPAFEKLQRKLRRNVLREALVDYFVDRLGCSGKLACALVVLVEDERREYGL